MVFALASVAASLAVYRITKVGLEKELLLSVSRMAVQLLLVGLYLTALFDLNHPAVNIAYILFMTAVANFAVLRNSGMKADMFIYTFPALALAVTAVSAYYMILVFRPVPIYDARHLIPITGMILGNSMNRTIVTLERFYHSVRRHSEGYAASIAMGATVREAAAAHLRIAYRAGLAPAVANMAAMGLASLPGMMTGQILGGSSPLTAVQYQIAIILAIYLATDLAGLLCVTFSMRRGFDDFGFLRNDIFKKAKADS
jgi:putative ABC transport system permease protein